MRADKRRPKDVRWQGTPERSGGMARRALAAAAALSVVLAAIGCTGDGQPSAGTPQSTSRESAALRGPRPAGVAERRTLLIVGTSLTAGLGLDPDQAYPALLQQKIDSAGLPFTVVNAGLSGETSAGALRRIDWLLQRPIDVFVLETGANDALRALDVDSTKAHIAKVIEAVRRADPSAAICVVQMEAPPNLGPQYTRAFHAMYPAVSRAEGATLLPFLLQDVAGHPSLNQSDGMHPNSEGERLVAATLWSSLAPVLRAKAANHR
jgi:acyl-CoA thioesterase I